MNFIVSEIVFFFLLIFTCFKKGTRLLVAKLIFILKRFINHFSLFLRANLKQDGLKQKEEKKLSLFSMKNFKLFIRGVDKFFFLN